MFSAMIRDFYTTTEINTEKNICSTYIIRK